MLVANMILCLLDSFGDVVLANKPQILKFIKYQLLSQDEETLNLGLSLLMHLVSTGDLTWLNGPDATKTFAELKVILTTLGSHPSVSVKLLLSEIRLKLMSLHSLKTNTQDLERARSEKRFNDAIKELADELLPIRAHGLAVLKFMVLEKDSVATEHLESIITIFLDMIGDEDSFIYLNAIKGMNAIADVYPREILKKLGGRYKDNQFDLDYRLRIGEAFLQIIQRSGSALNVNGAEIIDFILFVMKDDVVEMRGSALSLLCQVLENHPSSCYHCIYQIMDYLAGILTFEQRPELRRGATLTLAHLFRGVGHHLRSLVDTKSTAKIRQVLTYIGSTDGDAIVRLNAQQALSDYKSCLM